MYLNFCKRNNVCHYGYLLMATDCSFAIILMGKRELIVSLCLSSWCLVIIVWLFLTMPRGCLQFVIVEFPDHLNGKARSGSISNDYRILFFSIAPAQTIRSGCLALFVFLVSRDCCVALPCGATAVCSL